MWRLLELSVGRVASAIGWGVLALGSGLALAGLAAWLIARAWQMPPVLDLSIAVVSVRALGISRGLCRYLERLATHDVALRSMTSARTSTYRALARSTGWLRRPSGAGEVGGLRRGDLLVRVGSDIDDLGAAVVRVLVPVAVSIILSAMAIGALATISPAAAGILAAALAVSGVLAPWLSARAAREAEHAVRADRTEFTAQALTVLDHAAELRVAGKLDGAVARATAAGRRAVRAEDRAAARTAWSTAATPLSIGVSALGALLIGIVTYGPNSGAPGTMTPMALAILVLLPLSAFESVTPLSAAAQAFTAARAALHRLASVDRAEVPRPTPAQGSIAKGGRITARSDSSLAACAQVGVVATAARGSAPTRATVDRADVGGVADAALSDRGIDLPPGRRIAIVGPSGSGKTTLLMSWAGLFGARRDDAIFFAEDAHLFGTSILENLRVARGDLTVDEAENALRAVGLGEWLETLAEGVATTLIGGAAAVSGGQRRRILLARALVSPARMLLLDEPTEHIEAEAGADLLRALLDPRTGLVTPDRTVVVVTHQLPAGHAADTVVEFTESGQVTTVFPNRAAIDFALRENPLPSR
ncbi:thiol reductant ABC exporter subunit CydC [Nocardia panacis]|uniref:Thiol reductant ABC exporter subunit CydC n=1 Tax=Nocardia panacis TaxID=2340916 RepID=A0A3A4KHF4_9NOCA|nr:thiol reductant ABC exporter subunit CydC [Nocardia panacis]RJO78880.1 thiol reductant ABC exporter subunit CydC [Nocardia panacis]